MGCRGPPGEHEKARRLKGARDALWKNPEDLTGEQHAKPGLPLQRLISADAMTSVATELHYNDITALYAAVGEANTSAKHVVSRLVAFIGGVDEAEEELAERSTPSTVSRRRGSSDVGVVVKGASDVWAKLARCCTPVPGDEILGFVTRGGGVSVHRTDCTNAGDLHSQPERLVDVEWAPSENSVFLVAIQVEALDRHRLLSDITKIEPLLSP